MQDDSRPNILLITTDQQRWDTLGCYGNPHVRTPHLDALAARGARFETAIVQNPVCIPSRACLQTGRYTHQHGVEYMESVIDDTPGLPPDELTVMERLQHAGYRTAAFGKIHMMPERGFHEQQVTGGKGQRWTRSAGLPIGLAPLGRDYAAWLEARDRGAYERIYEQRRTPEYRRDKGTLSNVLPLEE
ncbi:MAG: sulfatase-like hydrolase/transferase [Kiritimatiellaeota bacterium]|nr:sulfatase-like hydrolase/transferase [Kiritimatiellota bacterium]